MSRTPSSRDGPSRSSAVNEAAALDPEGAALGLYLHVPFCEAKCSYCHFAIDPRRPDDARQERYLAEAGVLVSNELFQAFV